MMATRHKLDVSGDNVINSGDAHAIRTIIHHFCLFGFIKLGHYPNQKLVLTFQKYLVAEYFKCNNSIDIISMVRDRFFILTKCIHTKNLYEHVFWARFTVLVSGWFRIRKGCHTFDDSNSNSWIILSLSIFGTETFGDVPLSYFDAPESIIRFFRVARRGLVQNKIG